MAHQSDEAIGDRLDAIFRELEDRTNGLASRYVDHQDKSCTRRIGH